MLLWPLSCLPFLKCFILVTCCSIQNFHTNWVLPNCKEVIYNAWVLLHHRQLWKQPRWIDQQGFSRIFAWVPIASCHVVLHSMWASKVWKRVLVLTDIGYPPPAQIATCSWLVLFRACHILHLSIGTLQDGAWAEEAYEAAQCPEPLDAWQVGRSLRKLRHMILD